MTLHEKIVALALAFEKYPSIDAATLLIIPTISKTITIIGDGDVTETITMDWLDASGQPMMGWGAETNVLIVHRSIIALLRADAGSKETKYDPPRQVFHNV